MSEHLWAVENLSDFVAGMMNAEESQRLAQHLSECAECRQALAGWRRLDDGLTKLFADSRPGAGVQDRLIQGLRTARRPNSWVAIGTGLAAAVLLGVVGWGMHSMAASGLPLPGNGLVENLFKGNSEREIKMGVDLLGGTELGEVSRLMHGTAHHGMNYDDPRLAATYYHRNGPVGVVMEKFNWFDDNYTITSTNTTASHACDLTRKEKAANLDVDKKPSTKELFGVEERGPIALRLKQTEGRDELSRYSPKPQKYSAFLGERSKYDDNEGQKSNKARAPLAGEQEAPDGGGEAPQSKNIALGRTFTDGTSKTVALAAKYVGQPAGPADDSRKIIRTGEMEFDVASFDAALKEINVLLEPSRKKGGNIATTNSDKLANGKMKGSAVVRIPPEFLDDFVRDLRKIGDLKSQRIGSVEVTKQYTDNEAEVRGLRITQERCEDIVKKGKGDTKDLIAAELLLNEVRTRIEKIEGENRYFNNQVALCTLTIRLTEKEIQNAAMLVFNEKITLTYAVEDLARAEDAVRTAVNELKGRVLKSDLKRQEGLVEMELEVAHENALKLSGRLKGLGDNIYLDEARSQQTEGGSTLGPQPKTRHADVHFKVNLRDLAGIKPQKIFNRKIASADVFKSVARLRTEILNKKGRITEDQSNEVSDQAKITATLEFDLAVQHREDIDKLLKDLGDQVEQGSVQLPPAESTKRKVGYKLTFVNLASQPPREGAILVVEVRNVEASLAVLRGLFKEAKGTIVVDRGPFDDKGELKGLMRSIVPLTSKQELVQKIRAMGTVKKQDFVSDPQAPESSLPLAELAIQLVGPQSIVPSDEGLWPQTGTSLYYSFRVLTMSVMFIVVGLCLVVPWALVVIVTVRVVRWFRGGSVKI